MHASSYVLLASSLLLPASPARGEVLRLKCTDSHGVLVVQYVIDTDRQRIEQNVFGGRLTRPAVIAITDQQIRFIDRSGEAANDKSLDRTTGELVSEIVEGPERGVSFYLTCHPTTGAGPGL
jgi:hypothetical protein